jgi:hypothetical protein
MPFVLTFTLHTRSWEIAYICIRERFSVGEPIDAHPGDTQKFVRLIFSERHIIFSHAGHHTTATPGAFIQINDHPKFMGFVVFHQNLLGLTMIN